MTTASTRRPPLRGEVTALSEHARAGRAARRSRLLRRLRTALLVLLPTAGAAWVLLVSTWLAVDRVEVRGEARLAAPDVVRAAAVADGTPLARVDLAAVARAVARLAPVADVEVSRSWPGTLLVEVTERTAVAGLEGATGVRLVDAEGVVFATERALPAGVVGLRVSAPGPRDPSTLAALEVLAGLPPALRAQVRTVRAPTPSAVLLVTRTNRQVRWGGPTAGADKAAAVLALLGRPATVIDVSAPGVVVTR